MEHINYYQNKSEITPGNQGFDISLSNNERFRRNKGNGKYKTGKDEWKKQRDEGRRMKEERYSSNIIPLKRYNSNIIPLERDNNNIIPLKTLYENSEGNTKWDQFIEESYKGSIEQGRERNRELERKTLEREKEDKESRARWEKEKERMLKKEEIDNTEREKKLIQIKEKEKVWTKENKKNWDHYSSSSSSSDEIWKESRARWEKKKERMLKKEEIDNTEREKNLIQNKEKKKVWTKENKNNWDHSHSSSSEEIWNKKYITFEKGQKIMLHGYLCLSDSSDEEFVDILSIENNTIILKAPLSCENFYVDRFDIFADSTAYSTDIFTKHITDRKNLDNIDFADLTRGYTQKECRDYLNGLIIQTFQTARKYKIFQKKKCRYGNECNSLKVKHMMTFYH